MDKTMTDEQRNDLGRRLSEFFAKTNPIDEDDGQVREAYLVVGFRETEEGLNTVVSLALDDHDTAGCDAAGMAEEQIDKMIAVAQVSVAAGAAVFMREKAAKLADQAGSQAVATHGLLALAMKVAGDDPEEMRKHLEAAKAEFEAEASGVQGHC